MCALGGGGSGVCARTMIYAHYDIRYIAYAFPEVYAYYAEHKQDMVNFSSAMRKGWSFTGSVPDPQHKLGKLSKFMREEIERIQSFD